MAGVRRPWKVFVRSVGPTFTFASEAAANARAAALVAEDGPDRYAAVDVYCVDQWATGGPLERVQYRYGEEPVRQVLDYDAALAERRLIGWADA